MAKRGRHESPSARGRTTKDSRGPQRRGRGVVKPKMETVKLPHVFSDFCCHICSNNHWTVECPRLLTNAADFPLMDRRRGCWKCAQRGHTALQCPIKKYHCQECGGMHDTKDCAYDHDSEEWHEFYDPARKHVYYANSETKEVQWMPPTHELDVVLWYCAKCKVLLPNKYYECLKCHTPRPVSADTQDSASSSSSSASHDDVSDSSSDSSHS